MSLRRYARTQILGFGTSFGTSRAIATIRERIASGDIRYKEDIVRGSERLDIIAGREYGDSSLFWVVAASSGIGWALQIAPSTIIRIPSLEDIAKYIG